MLSLDLKSFHLFVCSFSVKQMPFRRPDFKDFIAQQQGTGKSKFIAHQQGTGKSKESLLRKHFNNVELGENFPDI